MDYKRIYDQIIERAQNRNIEGYIEKHHIIPRCMGGSDDKDNLAELTAREHFVAHRLLCEIYPENHKLQYALWRMANSNKNKEYGISSRKYEKMKKKFSELMTGENNPAKRKEVRDKLREIKTGYKMPKNATDKIRNKKIGTVVVRDLNKLSKGYFQITQEEFYNNDNLISINEGVVRSDEFRENLREKNKGQNTLEWYIEMYGEDGIDMYEDRYNDISNKMKKWHKDNKGIFARENNPCAKEVQCLQENCCGDKIYGSITGCAGFHNMTMEGVRYHLNGNAKNPKFQFIEKII